MKLELRRLFLYSSYNTFLRRYNNFFYQRCVEVAASCCSSCNRCCRGIAIIYLIFSWLYCYRFISPGFVIVAIRSRINAVSRAHFLRVIAHEIRLRKRTNTTPHVVAVGTRNSRNASLPADRQFVTQKRWYEPSRYCVSEHKSPRCR